MKLFQFAAGTNPARVTLYLAEKGLDVPRIVLDAERGEHKSPGFLRINPAGKTPVLELDDGSFLPESAAIVEHLEELNPDPPMIGTTPQTRAEVRALERMANDLIVQSTLWLMHAHSRFARRVRQEPLVAAALKTVVEEGLRVLEIRLGTNKFLAGISPTVADCSLFSLFYTCRAHLGVPLGGSQPGLDTWYERFLARPSVNSVPRQRQSFSDYLRDHNGAALLGS